MATGNPDTDELRARSQATTTGPPPCSRASAFALTEIRREPGVTPGYAAGRRASLPGACIWVLSPTGMTQPRIYRVRH